jgi:uncharacterized heparinase superfamily protein
VQGSAELLARAEKNKQTSDATKKTNKMKLILVLWYQLHGEIKIEKKKKEKTALLRANTGTTYGLQTSPVRLVLGAKSSFES